MREQPSFKKTILNYFGKGKLDIAKSNFVFRSTSIWNSLANFIFSKLRPTTVVVSDHSKSYINDIIIPGSSINSDLTTPVGFFKSKTRSILLQLHNKGDATVCDYRNFDPKYIDGPCWTWGL